MRWEDDEVRMTSLKTSEDTRALETRSVHGGGYVPQKLPFASYTSKKLVQMSHHKKTEPFS